MKGGTAQDIKALGFHIGSVLITVRGCRIVVERQTVLIHIVLVGCPQSECVVLIVAVFLCVLHGFIAHINHLLFYLPFAFLEEIIDIGKIEIYINNSEYLK